MLECDNCHSSWFVQADQWLSTFEGRPFPKSRDSHKTRLVCCGCSAVYEYNPTEKHFDCKKNGINRPRAVPA
jgi:hypothetical protein